MRRADAELTQGKKKNSFTENNFHSLTGAGLQLDRADSARYCSLQQNGRKCLSRMDTRT